MSVGESLAQARAERGLSVDDVATATRIRATLIRGIEADDYSGCGGDFYVRGHIRSIARVVGVDPAPLVEAYDAAHGGPPAPLTTVPLEAPAAPPAAPKVRRERRRRPNWAAASIAALVIICAAAAAELVMGNGGGTGQKSALTPNARTSSSAPVHHPKPASSPPAGAVAVVPLNKVTVLLRVTGSAPTWVSVTSSAGATVFQGLMQPGSEQTWTDPQSLSLVIGNAPVVDLVVNAHDVGSPPSQNDVARLTFTRSDFTGSAG